VLTVLDGRGKIMKKKINFIKLIRLWGIIFLLGIGVSIIAIDVMSSYRDFNSRSDQMRTDYVARQKQIIKQEVDHAVDLISYEKAQGEIRTKEKIKSRGYEAHAIAQNIYHQNKASKSESEIQKIILDALRPIRFEHGSGYYFATRFDGTEMLFADKPEMEGLNLLDVQDTRGRYVFKDMIEIAKQSGEGFYEYHGTKPDSAGSDFRKISFVKRFESYDWFIGTGLYVDDVESQVEADLLSTISGIRFGKEGYIFINRLNGDALVSNGELLSGTKKLWEVFDKNPEKMKDIFEKEHNAALKPNGDYIYYSHVKLTTPNIESPKVSFIRGIPALQWLVGAGVYLDDVETDIALMRTELDHQIKKKTLFTILIVVGIIALFFLFFNRLTNGLKNDFNLFISFFTRAARSDEEIDREAIKFVELDQMGEYANKMIAERKRAEEALKDEATWRRILIGESRDGIVVLDQNGKVYDANRRYAEMIGYSMEEVMQLHVWDWDTQWTREQLLEMIERVDEAGDRFETRHRRKDGTFYDVEISTNGSVFGGQKLVLCVCRDITERKRAEEERLRLEQDLRQAQKLESIGNLAGGIAHDFNNILSSIIGYTELALDDVEKGTSLEDQLQEVYKAGKRARDLVKQILAFARQSDEEKRPIQVVTIAEEALKLIRSTIPTTIEIKQNMESNSLIMGNASQVHQLFMNLCTNAAQAMEDAGGILEVTLKDVELDNKSSLTQFGLKPGKYLKATISDNGPGIASDVIDSIFEPYFTTKGVGEGTGMGLAMVHGIVEAYGGKIAVDSELGKGSVFSIYLPITKKREDYRPYEEEKLPSGTERILFVDDELPIAKMGSEILGRLGYQVTVCTSSVEALELFRSKPNDFDLVITDMTMPNMTGDALAMELIAFRSDTPVILCTGYSKKITDEKAAKIGIRAFAYKPIIKADLAKTVRKVLDDRQEQTTGRILLIDDESAIRKLFIQKLAGSGYEIIEACDGKEGLKLYRENRPDLVITDLVMPEKEGIETITELKREFPNVKIIAISGGGRNVPDAYLHVAEILGAERTFPKPIDWPGLIKTIRELLK
jgi:PAS domain S-box-containing protein